MLKRYLFFYPYDLVYRFVVRPLLFVASPARSHAWLVRFLSFCDNSWLLLSLFSFIRLMTIGNTLTKVGDTTLPSRFIVAAGLVKGLGFADEESAWQAVQKGDNIVIGWRSVPALLGAVEFGSFTRFPRMGNDGVVLWRDPQTQSTQNRIGLKNAGAIASAEFLAQRRKQLPAVFGINIAVSPQTNSPEQEAQEIQESVEAFLSRQVIPSWFTLNLSCPNTDDDPHGNQTTEKAERLCGVFVKTIHKYGLNTPLWVKISPNLAHIQLESLMQTFANLGVKAVIATNTLPSPTPVDSTLIAGVGGGQLFPHALQTVKSLIDIATKYDNAPDIIACGGILDGKSYRAYQSLGVRAVQYWSALVYRGLLAAPLIESEAS